ncbi:hypothetical protein EJ05DRAFT_212615 [Pseudovirgaria hyperparasitica]|uniref:Uncharacterized protein n=1 Tax=Pseudovirgaria hyperparasitica TaxID=470096 RepID=A0A6A6VUR8_9PEZI|nr:uncharacterized protein EJ05DRAFT_212615 [Pseudovirgaria hyperparasitica]KAF2753360.1 hypothetical protein EJ05DRAFT_212615 [Pseudovirgaria hyperparasitica]
MHTTTTNKYLLTVIVVSGFLYDVLLYYVVCSVWCQYSSRQKRRGTQRTSVVYTGVRPSTSARHIVIHPYTHHPSTPTSLSDSTTTTIRRHTIHSQPGTQHPAPSSHANAKNTSMIILPQHSKLGLHPPHRLTD